MIGKQERQAVLRDEDAALLQRVLAGGEELRRVQHGRGADRLGGIDDDGVEALVRLGDELAPVGDDDDGALVIEGVAGDLGIVFQRGVDHLAVDLAQHRLLDGGMLQDLAQDAAVAAADDQHALGLVERHQRHVRHHLVVDELVRAS